MAEPLELLTSVDDFHDLHLLADSRKGMVKVEIQKLRNLCIDHTLMINALAKQAVRVKGPVPPRTRERID